MVDVMSIYPQSVPCGCGCGWPQVSWLGSMENRGVVLQSRSSARRRAERLPSKARAALFACAAGLGATGLGVTGLGVTGLGVTLLAAAAALVPAAHAQVLQPHDLQSIQPQGSRSEDHTSELQSLMRISYAVFCLQKKNKKH